MEIEMGASHAKNAWNMIADSYQQSVKISTDDVHFGPFCRGEQAFQLLGDVRGKDIIDLGCGGGQNSIALAKWGATVQGIDISDEQIRHARDLAAKAGTCASFSIGDMQTLDEIGDRSVDVVLSVFALEYVERFDRLCSAVARILRPNGIFVFSDFHPFVSAGDVLNVLDRRFWSQLNYFDSDRVDFDWEFPAKTCGRLVRFHRTLEEYIRSLRDANFEIEDLREPRFDPGSSNDSPYVDETLLEDTSFWHRVPYTIIIKARHRRSWSSGVTT